MKTKLVYIGILWLLGLSTAFGQVTGKIIVQGQTDHSGVKVKFIAQSPTAKTDSFITNPDGVFSKNVIPGLYQITFSKTGYKTVFYQNTGLGQNILLSANTNLSNTYLLSGKYLFTSGARKGKLSKDTVYIFTDNLIINPGETLTVEPGTILSFFKDAKVVVDGSFITKGNIKDSITFTSYDALFEHKWPVSWGGFIGTNFRDTFNLEYCNINYLSTSYWSTDQNVIMPTEIWSGNTKIINCKFNYCPYVFGSFKNGNSVILKNNSILNCLHVGIIYGPGYTGNTNFTCNYVFYNSELYVGGLNRSTLYHHFISAGLSQIQNNVYNFNGYNNSGNRWMVREKDSKVTFKNNLLTNYINIYNAIPEQDETIVDMIFENNTFNGGSLNINDLSRNALSKPFVLNNNIFNTNVVISSIFGHINNIKAEYSIFSKYVSGLTSQLGFGQNITANQNGDSVDTFFNLFMDPKFRNGEPPFLNSRSPAINAGKDALGNTVNIGFDPAVTCLEKYFPKPTQIITADTLTISGKVHKGSGLLNDGIVMAISKLTGKTWTTKISDNGNFKVDSLKKGHYVLYAIPNPETEQHYLPTYYVNKLIISEAIGLNLQGHILDVDIYLIAKSATETGTAKIHGRFSYADGNTDDTTSFKRDWFNNPGAIVSPIAITGQPCKNMPLLLYNSSNQVIKSTMTDADGYFNIMGLAGGNYKVAGQRFGYQTENEGAVTLEAQETKVISLRMTPGSTTGLSDLTGNDLNSFIAVFPNPFHESLLIKGSNGKIGVSDITGNIIFEGIDVEKINTTNWPDGIYFIKTGNLVQKVMKQ